MVRAAAIILPRTLKKSLSDVELPSAGSVFSVNLNYKDQSISALSNRQTDRTCRVSNGNTSLFVSLLQ